VIENGVKPTLQFVLGGLPAAATGVAALPVPAIVPQIGLAAANYQKGFVVVYRGAAEADVVRFFDDAFAAPARPFLVRSSAVPLSATPNGGDSRSIAIDPTDRASCESGCKGRADQTACLTECARIPLAAYISNRSPPALLIAEVRNPDPTGSTETVATYDSIPLAQGPSRVVIGRIKDRQGIFQTRVFVLCFDARVIFVYDPVGRRVDGEIRTGRGPHSLVMDPKEAIAYIGHFTDSYIGLIDLDQSHANTFESIVGTIGVPTPPAVSK
jgi:hypothetical protein